MTKSELIDMINKRYSGFPHRDIDMAVKLVLDEISDALSRGERVEIRGFGSFSVRHYNARKARNPRTGTPVTLTARSMPYFKPGKELKQCINKVNK